MCVWTLVSVGLVVLLLMAVGNVTVCAVAAMVAVEDVTVLVPEAGSCWW